LEDNGIERMDLEQTVSLFGPVYFGGLTTFTVTDAESEHTGVVIEETLTV
jgi:hypothetical protein